MNPRDPQEPERWIVSADAPPDLRALLEVARREGPSIVQRASLGTRLGLSMQQALVGVGTKGFAAVTIVLAGVTGAGLGLSAGRSVPVDVPPAVSQVEAPAPPVATPDPEAAAAVLEPQQTTELSSPPPVAPPAKPPSEATLIRSAHDALLARPGEASTRRARGYLERHRRLYPEGQLAQEREVLLIEVLRLEGREAEANARAAEFRQKNPDSAHRPVAP
jgi:hypothetical protein